MLGIMRCGHALHCVSALALDKGHNSQVCLQLCACFRGCCKGSASSTARHSCKPKLVRSAHLQSLCSSLPVCQVLLGDTAGHVRRDLLSGRCCSLAMKPCIPSAESVRGAALRVWDAPRARSSVNTSALFTQTCIWRAHDRAVTSVQHIQSPAYGMLLTASQASPSTLLVPHRRLCASHYLHTIACHTPTQAPAFSAKVLVIMLSTAEQDTLTTLWTLKGQCIGVFGKGKWVLNYLGSWTDPLGHSMRPALRDASGKARASITDPHSLPAGAPRARAMARSIMRRASACKGALKAAATEYSHHQSA